MKDRIRKLRRTLDLTQKEFGQRIGVKPNTIATYEMGRNNPIDSVITLICREYGVREDWLRNGEGEMFIPAPTSELDALAAKYPNMTHETYVFIEKLLDLSVEDQNVIMGFFREVVAGFATPPETSPTLDAEALHAELDRQISMEKGATEKSGAS